MLSSLCLQAHQEHSGALLPVHVIALMPTEHLKRHEPNNKHAGMHGVWAKRGMQVQDWQLRNRTDNCLTCARHATGQIAIRTSSSVHALPYYVG